MANTMTLIASSTVGSGGAASFNFTTIPQTYTDLNLVLSARFDSAVNYFTIAINGSSSSYSMKEIFGSGTGTASDGYTTPSYLGFANRSNYTANTFGSASIYIPNYAGSTNKSISADTVMENNASAALAGFAAALFSVTSAITSITLTPDSGNFVQYSTAYLYGVKNA
jgi:hypothetical protein